MFDQFNQILSNWSKEVAKNNEIEAIIQFGSTCSRPIKKETDVDILYILNFHKKLSRSDSYRITNNWDLSLEKTIKNELKDYNIIVNSLVKTVSQLDHLSPIYLDFPDRSNILFDRFNHAKNLLDNIKTWITRNKAQRIQKGNLWYWIYDDKPSHIPVDFKF